MRRFWALSLIAAVSAIGGPAVGAAASSPPCKHWEGDPTTPCLVVTPPRGPVGTHVRFHGTIPSDQISRYDQEWHSHPFYGLTGEFPASKKFPQGCELILPAQRLKIALDTSSGVVEGSFTVGPRGTCSQNAGTSNARTTYAAMPGAYSLFIGSLTTYIATFHVTSDQTSGQAATPAKTTAPPKTKTPAKASHEHARKQHTSPVPPSSLPFTGPPILQLVLLGGAVLCGGVAVTTGTPRTAPAGRRRA